MTHLELARSLIRDVPDFKPGLVFKDITPVLKDYIAVMAVVDAMRTHWFTNQARSTDEIPTVIAGMESRGFIFGCYLSGVSGLGFVPLRKPGKLPWKKHSVDYDLEYGSDTLEIHQDAVQGERVLIVDDLLATGGTALAAKQLIEKAGGIVMGFSFMIELEGLKGRDKLGDSPTQSVFTF